MHSSVYGEPTSVVACCCHDNSTTLPSLSLSSNQVYVLSMHSYYDSYYIFLLWTSIFIGETTTGYKWQETVSEVGERD